MHVSSNASRSLVEGRTRDGFTLPVLAIHVRFLTCTLIFAAATLSPMHFTHCTPGHDLCASFTGSTLQIYCIKIKIDVTKDKLNWPLYVYGVVAARDRVDHNRNLLFCQSRANCQKLTPDVCMYGIQFFLFPSSCIYSC
jgi:hypothetical protein